MSDQPLSVQRIAVWLVGAALIMSIAGIILLAALEVDVPTPIEGLPLACLTGLLGLLVPREPSA